MKLFLILTLVGLVSVATIRVLNQMITDKFNELMNDWSL